ncbi:Cell division cycle-associated 7-like protein [Camellia lanceoleosa]|uniref:Cell division cycle-associated 7-like protein n=1 Tax=Camellia lanceoleosa TaxID=1840588 RepID=A0ACC0IQC9_9ERIC|nr:Cell division cycle-associated 7-like protein [Camellia lanceoleosa]
MDFVAACKNLKKDKSCTIKFCHKCLWNKLYTMMCFLYGEKTEDVAFLEDWNCPKCRGICNCSFCRKKLGHQPTGILVHTAKTTGFSSVSEMLHAKGPENFGIKMIVKGIDGTELTAVGHALQFLEFCASFDEILDLKEGEPEDVLYELIRGGRGSGEVYLHFSPVITPKVGKDSWLNSLQNCTSRSPYILKKLKLERKIRSWIEDQNSKFAERVKEAKERVVAAKHKEKQLKQKMKDKVAKAVIAKNGVPLSIFEHEAIVSQIKTGAAQAHTEMVESKGMLPYKQVELN